MSTTDMILAAVIVVLGAVGTYLMLPHRHGVTRPRTVFGAGLASAGLALLMFLTFWSPPAAFLPTVFLYVFGITAIVGALLTVTSRNPVYSALWFASVVLSTSGLFLLAGAPFLAAGTVIVYAGAIIVTFLFVIMLAQMEGKAVYDRAARAPAVATFTCYLLFWCLIVSLSTVHPTLGANPSTERGRLEPERLFRRSHDIINSRGEKKGAVVAVLERALPATTQIFVGYDLRLMPSKDDVGDIPREGTNLMVVADVNNALYFRIFDSDGKMVVDTQEKSLPDKARQIEDLKKDLESVWPPLELPENVKDRLVTEVASIVGYPLPGIQKPNVAGLGGSLYTDHLVTVGLASALLFVALVGAVAITNPRRPGSNPDPAQAATLGTNRP